MISDENFIKKQKMHFDRIAPKYKEDIAPHVFDYYLATKTAYVLRNLKSPANSILLDVGCGLGEHAIDISKKVNKVIATDISHSMVHIAKGKGNNRNIGYLTSNAIELPFKSNTFDVVYSMGLLHHLVTESNCINYLRESGRVIKDNGYVFISDINANNPLWTYILKKARYTDVGDETIWGISEVKKFFREADLEIADMFYFGAVGNFIPQLFVPLFDLFGKIIQKSPLHSLGAHYYMIGKKQGN